MIKLRKVWRSWMTGGLALLLGVLSGVAQAPPDRLGEIEKQIQTLKQMVEDLRRATPLGEAPKSAPGPEPEARVAATNEVSATAEKEEKDPIARIREEGMERSQVMETLSYLSDVIGPRLTGSPNLSRANRWTMEKLTSWGLTNVHLEPWGPFGRGWSLKRFSAQIVEPQGIPLSGYPKAWSPGLKEPLVGEVIYLEAKKVEDLEAYKGKLENAVVLTDSPRGVNAGFEPKAVRMAETNLLRLANAGAPRRRAPRARPRPAERAQGGGPGSTNSARAASSANPPRNARGRGNLRQRLLPFLEEEGAALVVGTSSQGDGGTLFVSSASVPPSSGDDGNARNVRAWSTNVPPMPAQMTLAKEDYNRLVRMIQQGEKLKMAIDLQVEFHDEDLMAYNVIAEIPGTDLQEEIVMLGGHIDSWHSGTGATDNGAGVAATMEAVRILRALNLPLRRTVRIGLWSGEEQGLYGSRAYVSEHFGYYTNAPVTLAAGSSNGESNGDGNGNGKEKTEPEPERPRTERQLVPGEEYDNLSAYFNLDYGAGRIRGVYMQGNEGVRPLFHRWLQPFKDLGAETLSFSGAGGTDHLSFDRIGLPGFQFIQDPLEYWTRTHHSNADVFDRVQPEDLKQAATIIAAFVYESAMMDEKVPRKTKK